jgi:hypothetical protein
VVHLDLFLLKEHLCNGCIGLCGLFCIVCTGADADAASFCMMGSLHFAVLASMT